MWLVGSRHAALYRRGGGRGGTHAKFTVHQNPTNKTLTDLWGALKQREARHLLHRAATVVHVCAATPTSSTTDVTPATATPSPSPWQAPPPSPKVYLPLSLSPYMCNLDVIHALFSRLMERPGGSIPRDCVHSIKCIEDSFSSPICGIVRIDPLFKFFPWCEEI
jgi:hypothetical protein